MKLFCFITFIFITLAGETQVNLSAGLTACYNLNGNAGDPVNNLTGTLSAVTPTVDRFNNTSSAMHFNGSSSSYIVLADNALLKPAQAISFSCWIKTPIVTNQYILFTKNSLNSYFEAFDLCIEPSMKFMTRKGGPNGMDMVLSTTSLSANTWYHLVTTIDNSFIKLYVDGALEASTPATFQGFDYVPGKKVFLGTSNEQFYDTPFNGTIDNARFYNRTLSAAEVSVLFSADPTCTTSDPAGLLKPANFEDDIDIFPNPTTGILHLKCSEASILNLYDLNGRIVPVQLILNGENSELDLSEVAAGIYFLEISTEENKQWQKVIKQ